jgi:hypothetical protein
MCSFPSVEKGVYGKLELPDWVPKQELGNQQIV